MGNLRGICLTLLILPSMQAADPVCHTPLGVPCHLIHYAWEQWTFFEKGITDIRHSSGEMTSGARRDGSLYSENATGGRRVEGLYLAPADKVVNVFPASQTYSSRDPAIWHDRPYRRSHDGDATCSAGILHNGTDFHLDAMTSEMFGQKVVHWNRPLANGGYEDIYMAPALDCTMLKHRMVYKNSFHLPRFISETEATSIQLGEPSSSLFSIPPNYRLVDDPQLPALKRFVAAQR